MVTAPITLYAKWTITTYTVSFSMNGFGVQVPAQSVHHGSAATAPAPPTDPDGVFVGWYTTAATTTAYDFSTPVTGDVTVFAKWSAACVNVAGGGVINGYTNGFYWTADSSNCAGGATIVNGDYGPVTTGNVVLPATFTDVGNSSDGDNVYKVTAIADDALQFRSITAITLPPTLRSIGANALWYNSLTSLTLPQSVTSIGTEAFSGNQITSITWPSGPVTLGDSVFSSNKLAALTLPSGLTAIPKFTFSNNVLTSVTLPEGLISVGEQAFASNKLTSLTLPQTVTTLGFAAFVNNPIVSVNIPASVTSLAVNVVKHSALKSVFFEGAPPATFAVGAVNTDGSFGFGTNLTGTSGPVLYFRPQFSELVYPGGFSTPQWKGYRTAYVPSAVDTVSPGRYWDTRNEPTFDGRFRNTGRLAGGQSFAIEIRGRGNVAGDATGVIANLTVIDAAGAGYATLYPCGGTVPTASTVNYTTGAIVANNAFVPLAANGTVCVFTSN
ncbi:MAG TPA: leucine-rich repeat protein, partial [Ilumatobacteraceae bacterium]|nr:leucine-rich repeat protein [Ilumatobacteraceae bacterium]